MWPLFYPPVEGPPPWDPDPVIEAYKKDVDRTLIRENLRRSPEERLKDLARLAKAGEQLEEAARRILDRH
jgi:hypothetical protein